MMVLNGGELPKVEILICSKVMPSFESGSIKSRLFKAGETLNGSIRDYLHHVTQKKEERLVIQPIPPKSIKVNKGI